MLGASTSLADRAFQWCVELLIWLAGVTGTTYNEINVIIFCVIWPLVTIGLIALCLAQRVQIRRLRRAAASSRLGEEKERPHRGPTR